MSLSHKHYEAIAEILRTEREDCLPDDRDALYTLSHVEDRLCAYFRSDNPAFDPARFRKAAQPGAARYHLDDPVRRLVADNIRAVESGEGA